MSTRCTTHFIDGGKTEAIIFRHTDGYPSGAGVDLITFLRQCKELPDNRLDDASMLAARYVVFLAQMFQRSASPIDFLSVRVMAEDSCDTAYRYVVDCGKMVDGLPHVTCFSCFDGMRQVPIE